MWQENCKTICLDKDQITFGEIHYRFSQTPAGKRLDTNVRWSRFQPSYISNPEWVKLIGYDANNLEHGRLTYGLTVWFINHQNQSDLPTKFNSEEQAILKLTALTHDWPEGFTQKGDVNYEAKTSQDEQEELSIITSAVISSIGDSYESTEIAHQVKNCLEDTKSKLGQAFNCIEAIGYLRTALIVWPQSEKTQDHQLSQQFKMLTNNVFYNSIPKLIHYSDQYYPARKFLLDRNQTIIQAFNMPESSFDGYGQDKPTKINNFIAARETWNKWISTINS